MQTATILGVLLAALLTLLLVLWQYFYKAKYKGRLRWVLATLRFISIFGLLILLLNPKISNVFLQSEKQNLIILIDDSQSMKTGDGTQQAMELSRGIMDDEALSERFTVRNYTFGRDLRSTDSLSFASAVTDISGALTSVDNIFGREESLAILITDGNQTMGKAYEFLGKELSYPVFSVVVGDTTRYADLRITQVNLNKYAFLKNRFPLELFLTLQGDENAKSRLTVRMDGRTVYTEAVNLSPENNSQKISTTLDADRVGLRRIDISVDSIAGERNTLNNRRRIPIEVIDEKTRVGLVSAVLHPDLGTLVKAIESNDQRSVTLLDPGASVEELELYDVFILYQPTPAFQSVYDFVREAGINTFTLTGPATDWRYLNRMQKGLEISNSNQTEEILPVLNRGFGLFDLGDFSVEDFPPLLGSLGEILITRPYESIIDQQIRGVTLEDPLLPVITYDNQRHAYLFGENIWKWRVQTYRNDQNFDNFDNFINKLILYLTSDGKRDRLSLDYEQLYNVVTEKKIKASFTDETYVFKKDATLNLRIKGADGDFSSEQTMLLNGNQYEASLGNLSEGDYTFTVTVEGENLQKEGRFTIEEFNVEQLYVSSNSDQLRQLSEGSGGELYFPDRLENLVGQLLNNSAYAPTQKSVENVVSLIDFKIMFALIILAFSSEWFIRKYNGLI
ncbi:VWA domain-containing protein [Muriicola soli]|uniref:VWA domain-containing protein n=1 Tax=Muriicola soli TaxID=2507538 RepID=A0A411E9A0_9FLAO|nr:VWA domain-containing protein [Muriicola soli]QBA64218.1 VWA domain-containing protein [Muriicola soli]